MSSLHSISCVLPSDLEAELNTTTDVDNTTDPHTIYKIGERLLQRLERRKKKFGPCEEVRRQVELTVVALNMLSCRTLRHAEQTDSESLKHIIMDNALKMLGQAGELCGGSDDDTSVLPNWFENERKRLLVQTTTLNNCACVLRKTGDLEGALNCLQAALGLETQILTMNDLEGCVEEKHLEDDGIGGVSGVGGVGSVSSVSSADSGNSTQSGGTVIQAPRANPAGTHLNMCAVLSKMKRHDEAMLHATSALSLIHEGRSPSIAFDGAGNKSSVRAIAHYNLGVEQESLGLLDAADSSYVAAMSVVVLDLGVMHPLTTSIQNNATEGLKAVERRKKKRRGKKKEEKKKKEKKREATSKKE
jgi:tetratricopeptide (TPR) repeat protein